METIVLPIQMTIGAFIVGVGVAFLSADPIALAIGVSIGTFFGWGVAVIASKYFD